jgi:hypothetical protein
MQTLAVMWNDKCVGKVSDGMKKQLPTSEAQFQIWEGYVLDEPIKAFGALDLTMKCREAFKRHGLKRPRIVDDEGYEVIMPAFGNRRCSPRTRG